MSKGGIEIDLYKIAAFWNVPGRGFLPDFLTGRLAPIYFFVAIFRGNPIYQFLKFIRADVPDQDRSGPAPAHCLMGGHVQGVEWTNEFVAVKDDIFAAIPPIQLLPPLFIRAEFCF